MKTILRNLFSVLRRFRVATVLNILGLTVAFAAFILIMMQVKYDLSFNRKVGDSKNLMRLEFASGTTYQCIMNYPLGVAFFESSPHIAEGVVMQFPQESVYEIEQNGNRMAYKEKSAGASPGLIDVFTFEMKEGVAAEFREPGKVIIPQSIAGKFFGTEPAIGKQIKKDGETLTIAGVYNDFPENSSIRNLIYSAVSEEYKEDWRTWSYLIFVKLDNPLMAEEVVQNFVNTQENPFFNSEKRMKEDFAASLRLVPFEDLHFIRNVEWDNEEKASIQTVLILIAIAVVLIFIAAINFANFSMALTPMRIKSINTQKVMGANVNMLRKALLTEAFCICLVSFLLSLGLV